jgi:uncharacterized protein YdhG (YjbR/CyaY superfamily)
MASRASFETHAQYFATLAPEKRAALEQIQALVQEKLPNARQCISYNIPAFKVNRVFFYFAAFKHHIGIYPPLKTDEKLISELISYRGEKGNLSFPLSKPIPFELIGRVAISLHKEYAGS